MSDVVKVSIVGAGGMGRAHAMALKTLKEANLVSVVDVVYEKARQFASELGIRAYGSLREMSDAEEVDAIWICTPSYSHGDVAVEAAKLGLHVFSEKPMALKIEDCNLIAEAVRKNKVEYGLGFVERFSPFYTTVKKMVEDGRLGDIAFAWSGRMGYLGPGTWYTRKAESGGMIVDLNIHDLDLLRWLCGDVESVYAECSRRLFQDLDIFNNAWIAIKFKGGGIGMVGGSWISRFWHTIFGLIGEKGSVTKEGDSLKTQFGVEGLKVIQVDQAVRALVEEDRAFIQSISGKPTMIATAEDGTEALRLALGAEESFRMGKPIKIR